MNENDITLARELDPILDDRPEPTIYLVSSKYTSLVRVNLVLLKTLLEWKKLPGVMITIDRPHQYVSHLLQLQGIDQSKLTFLDAISKHASDTKAGVKGSEYQGGPFYIENLPAFIAGTDGGSPSFVDIRSVRFVIIDNVSTLLTYNSMESLKEFFTNYVDVTRELAAGSLITVFVMDKDLHKSLFEYVLGMSAKVIELTPDMRIGEVRAAVGGRASTENPGGTGDA